MSRQGSCDEVTTPAWADRLARDWTARGMSQREAAERLVLHADESLPGLDSVLRSWKRWERG